MKQVLTKIKGIILESLSNVQFKVKLENGQELRGYLSGKMRRNNIKVLIGDKVTLEITPNIKLSDCVARIIYRN